MNEIRKFPAELIKWWPMKNDLYAWEKFGKFGKAWNNRNSPAPDEFLMNHLLPMKETRQITSSQILFAFRYCSKQKNVFVVSQMQLPASFLILFSHVVQFPAASSRCNFNSIFTLNSDRNFTKFLTIFIYLLIE